MKGMKFIINQPKANQGIINAIKATETPYIAKKLFGNDDEETAEIVNVAADADEEPYIPLTLEAVLSPTKAKGGKPEVNSWNSGGEEPYIPLTLATVFNNQDKAKAVRTVVHTMEKGEEAYVPPCLFNTKEAR